MKKQPHPKPIKISNVGVTHDKISGRGGIYFVLRYIENISFYQRFEKLFNFLKGSAKGLSTLQFLKQVLAYFIDGSDMSLTSFDHRKQDAAYAALLENTPEEMASSHQIKRFFRKFMLVGNWLFRKILLQLFIWRLHIDQPDIIVLFADTMVLDNNDAHQREGVEPTYKQKKGFQPFQISWKCYVVDAIFRTGSVHGNHGTEFKKAMARLTLAIRKKYRDVPIIVTSDSAFMDDDNFSFFEQQLNINYICSGKQYEDLKQYVQQLPPEQFNRFSSPHQSWRYTEFGNRLQSWSTFRRCIFTTLEHDDNGQLKLEFVQSDSFTYTNMGQDPQLSQQLIQAGGQDYLSTEKIIQLNHQRGAGEINHRSIKEFATKEQLPFERLGMNRAYYYLMIISYFLQVAYKYDVAAAVISLTSYPTTFRRQLIDFAAKIVATGGEFILKVTQVIYDHLNIKKIWELSGAPPPLPIT
jgi:hypothetical protein